MFGEQELNELEQKFNGGDPAFRINLHIVLPDDLIRQVQALNAMLNKDVRFSLRFDDDSIMQPHITLFIGTINTRDFDEVCNILQEEFKNLPALKIEFQNYEISKNGRWAFAYIKQNSALNSFIKNLHTKLRDYVKFDWASAPHITLARADNLRSKQQLLSTQKLPTTFTATQFTLGICGTFGTVLKPLASFPLA